ncbi:unnamed protein product [Phytomonas sp. EM1]|nr:unnamed protein product [Phytomonas sp. EM1]|eukprot:CCW60678.1 unnamed protein product [Phytomonas sp. isolate EM1]
MEDVDDPIDWVKPQPGQNTISLLLNLDDFKGKVADDPANLCCVIVTSTLCRHSGITKVPYPKHFSGEERLDETEYDDDDDDENDDTEDNADDNPQESFFKQIKMNLVLSEQDVQKRRHVRFFHVCACMKEETDIRRLIAASPVFKMTGRAPTEQERASLHHMAHKQLVELLHFLEVYSTPSMFFFVRGEKVRYPTKEGADVAGVEALTNPKGRLYPRDLLVATGSNYVKWKYIMRNAVVIRNEILKDYDAEMREMAKRERMDARRRRILERKNSRKQAEESEEFDYNSEDGY